MSFALLAEILRRKGYCVVNAGYPSTRACVRDLALATLPQALSKCGDGPIHFVTHSMGGILLRAWLAEHEIPRLGRAVMLAPPNRGSELVDILGHLPPFEWFHGPAGRELGTEGLPKDLPCPACPVGIITGSLSLNPITSALIGRENDGKIAVDSTHLERAADHITMPVTHMLLMNNPLAIEQILAFLAEGRFRREELPAPPLLRQRTARLEQQA
jgi:hypothetical protein